MNNSNNIILVTFDQHRIDYPTMSYSVASILATLKHYHIPASHYSFDIRDFKKTEKGYMPYEIMNIYGISEYLKQFSCIAFGVTRWSKTYAYMLIKHLNDSDYKGKIVVGGYEITAMNEDHQIVDMMLNIQHFIQGYSEKPLVKLMQGKYPDDQKFIREELDPEYLFSPYCKGILNTYSRKIYWETKRGCTYGCGFCEWGNAHTGMLSLDSETIDRDIEIFSQSTIDEINILDATFNVKNDYQVILQKLIDRTNSRITFQARFEALKPEFLQFCASHKERLHLEFGLQTIHKNEMEVIGRKNSIELIRNKLHELNHLGIDYEVSIIYAIPSQTLTSFIDTIEFLRVNQCEKIMAYPLQIPLNSNLERKIKEYEITFKEDEFYVRSVASSLSFTKEEREDMDKIASSLANAYKPSGMFPQYITKIEHAQYQYELNAEYFKGCGKLPESIIFRYRGVELHLDYGSFLAKVASKGIDSCLWPETFSENANGNYNGVKPEKIHNKIVFGESGHFYTYWDQQVTL